MDYSSNYVILKESLHDNIFKGGIYEMDTIEQDYVQKLLTHRCIHRQLSVPQLIEKILKLNEGSLTDTGAICVETGKYTGRSPMDRFIVHDEISDSLIHWGKVNQPIDEKVFESLLKKVSDYLQSKREIFSFKGFAGADPTYQLPVRVINEYAWHNLFAHQMLIRPMNQKQIKKQEEFTIISAPSFKASPVFDQTKSEAFIMISFKKRIILIGGTKYAGEIKKSIFSVMNFLLPQQDVLPMHCSANIGRDNDIALFFGLSGTGKTTLSADSHRKLIGDDEHGWSPKGIFNIEGGCYAKTINLSGQEEPEIYNAIRFGAILENVMIDANSRQPDYTDSTRTENTRAAYPLENMEHTASSSITSHPRVIFFLTADATGTLPPISILTKEQAMYHFLSGYTSKLAGTERGITKPELTFSTCFGAPFLPLKPAVYAEMLGDKIDQFHTKVFLVNTGWTGGPYGIGKRIKLSYTRAMIHAALKGKLHTAKTIKDEIFGLAIPTHVPGVPEQILIPKQTWNDQNAYNVEAKKLANAFHENFIQFDVSEVIKKAGPIYRH